VPSNATLWIREHLATAPAIYGLVVFEVLVSAESDDPEEPALLVLMWTFITFLGFYIAHVFAEVVARHGSDGPGRAIRRGFSHSNGMLYAAVLPTVALLIAAAFGQDGPAAAGWTLLVSLIVLGFLGFEATAQRRPSFWARLGGGVLTALVGFIVIVVEYLVH